MTMALFPMDKGNQLRPIPGLDFSSPEIHVKPKLEKAAELGVTSSSLGYAVNALIDGAYAGITGTKVAVSISSSAVMWITPRIRTISRTCRSELLRERSFRCRAWRMLN